MRFDLARMYAGRKPRKRVVTFDRIALPSTLASDLFAAGYAPAIARWTEAVPAIVGEYERSLDQLTRDTAADLSNVIASTDAGISSLHITLRPRLERWAARAEEMHRQRWAASVKRGTGLDIKTLVGAGDMRVPLGTAIERNVELVRSVSDQARARISDAVFRGLQQRKPAREVAAEIREAVAMSRRRALNIAGDQLSKISETLNEERRREAGVMTWEWVSSHKTHFRPEHAARDGKRYDDTATSGASAPPQDRPGQLPFCGCTSRAVLDLDEAAAPAAPVRPARKPEPSAPPPPAPAKGFRSPVNPDVTADTIEVRPRATLQREMTAELRTAAADQRYSPLPEFNDRLASDFGAARFSTAFTDEAVSLIAAVKPELDNLADQLKIPRIRGFKTITKARANANMGDGVMGLNPDSFNARAATVGGGGADALAAQKRAEIDAIVAEMNAIAQQVSDLTRQMRGLDGSIRNPLWSGLAQQQQALVKRHGLLRTKYRKADIAAQRARQAASKQVASTWKPGDSVDARPWSVGDYQTGIDQARSTLFHEFGHHVHQQLGKTGRIRDVGAPPMERKLWDMFQTARITRGDRQPSTYAMASPFEWFAENFSAFVMGRRDLVDPELNTFIEELFNGS